MPFCARAPDAPHSLCECVYSASLCVSVAPPSRRGFARPRDPGAGIICLGMWLEVVGAYIIIFYYSSSLQIQLYSFSTCDFGNSPRIRVCVCCDYLCAPSARLDYVERIMALPQYVIQFAHPGIHIDVPGISRFRHT